MNLDPLNKKIVGMLSSNIAFGKNSVKILFSFFFSIDELKLFRKSA